MPRKKENQKIVNRGSSKKQLNLNHIKQPSCANRTALVAVIVFTFLAMYWSVASRLRLVLDEGIYIQGAQRILNGDKLYIDFFALTGPGTYWLNACLLKIDRVFIGSHLILCIEVALILGTAYWITSADVGKLAGITAASGMFLLVNVFDYRLYINHRWDSLCCLSVSLALFATNNSRWTSAVAGCVAGVAIIFTPPSLWFVIASFTSIALFKEHRNRLAPFLVGLLILLIVCVSLLAWQASLSSLISTISWVARSYRQANTVPYGFLPNLNMDDISWLRKLLMETPALLPAISLLCFVLVLRKGKLSLAAQSLLLGGVGILMSCYPRVAADQLLFASSMFISFLLIAVCSLVSKKTFSCVCYAITISSLFGPLFLYRSPLVVADTRLGSVHCTFGERKNIQFVTATVQPGESVFVYPYQPIWYPLTGGRNPTHYDFLQPGMMTADDESKALAALELHPPQWVIWHSLPATTVLAIWPNSNLETLKFSRIERFIRSHYRQVRPPDRRTPYAVAIFGLSSGT